VSQWLRKDFTYAPLLYTDVQLEKWVISVGSLGIAGEGVNIIVPVAFRVTARAAATVDDTTGTCMSRHRPTYRSGGDARKAAGDL